MSSQPVCPCYHPPRATQGVAAIVACGTQQVRVLTAGLAQLLAPPSQPGG